MKTLTAADANTDTNVNADTKGSTIALCKRCSGKLKMATVVIPMSMHNICFCKEIRKIKYFTGYCSFCLFVLRFYSPVNPMGHVERSQFA